MGQLRSNFLIKYFFGILCFVKSKKYTLKLKLFFLLKITDPLKKEAEEAIVLALEIIKERHSLNLNSRPDVVPSYIKNRPVPQAQETADPRPKIGPLSATGTYVNVDQESPAGVDYTSLQNTQEDLYIDMVQQQQQPIAEEQYLDLEEAKQEYMKTVEQIEPDPDI